MEQDRLSTDFQASRQQQNPNAVWVRALGSCLLAGSTISFWGNAALPQDVVGTGNIQGDLPDLPMLGTGKGHRRTRCFQPAQPRGSTPGAAPWFAFGAMLSRAVPQTALPTQCSQEGTRSKKRMQNVRPDSQLGVPAPWSSTMSLCTPKGSSLPLSHVPLPAPGSLSTLSHHYPGHFKNHPKELKHFLEAFPKPVKPSVFSSVASVLCPPPQVNIFHKILSLHWNVSTWP